ncbi:MAG TPA: hypothetical protein PLJ74_12010 [Myxococcota bacterium]|nr:hypothetical protein [Myxococcota bacterium]
MTQVVRIQTPGEAALSIIQREFPNYHPIVSLARLAHKQEVVEDPKLEFEIHKTLLPYVMPRLSSVEVKQDIKEERRVIVSLFEAHELEDGRIIETEVPLVTDVTDIVKIDN